MDDVLIRILEPYGSKVVGAKFDLTDNEKLAERFLTGGLVNPEVLLFENGEEIARYDHVWDLDELRQFPRSYWNPILI